MAVDIVRELEDNESCKNSLILNQARASHRPAHVWFLKIDPVWIVTMRFSVCVVCVSVSVSKAINNCGVILRDVNLIQLVK